MSEVKLTIQIRGLVSDPKPYRLYVDNDLITERTYIWGTRKYISEHVYVDLEPGIHHVRVETIKASHESYDYFNLLSIFVGDKRVPLTHNTNSTIIIN